MLFPVRRSSFEPLARPDWATFKATHLSTPTTFKRYLRVSEEIFDYLADGIRPSAERQARAERAGQNSAGKLAGKLRGNLPGMAFTFEKPHLLTRASPQDDVC